MLESLSVRGGKDTLLSQTLAGTKGMVEFRPGPHMILVLRGTEPCVNTWSRVSTRLQIKLPKP